MKELMENWRGYINEQERVALEEGIFQDAMTWLKSKGQQAQEKAKKFLESLREELSETKVGIMLLQKIAAGKELSDDESQFLKDQAKDIASGTALLALFALPGGGIASAALLKMARKFGVELMPSSFLDESELAERDWQKESEKLKDHPNKKARILDTGANKETGGGTGHRKLDKRRGKSAPPGAGGV